MQEGLAFSEQRQRLAFSAAIEKYSKRENAGNSLYLFL